jgi:hypothetical protein
MLFCPFWQPVCYIFIARVRAARCGISFRDYARGMRHMTHVCLIISSFFFFSLSLSLSLSLSPPYVRLNNLVNRFIYKRAGDRRRIYIARCSSRPRSTSCAILARAFRQEFNARGKSYAFAVCERLDCTCTIFSLDFYPTFSSSLGRPRAAKRVDIERFRNGPI